jgi:YD repeat-containing protein
VISSTSSSQDAAGRVVASTGADGQTTTYEYDAAGRRVSVRDALGHSTTFIYDSAGRQTNVVDALARSTSVEYDALGRPIKTIFHDGTFTQTLYDEVGQRVAEVDQAGVTNAFRYDTLGHLTNVVKAAVPDPEDSNTLTAPSYSYNYDTYGRMSGIRDPKSRVTQFAYDQFGRQVSRTLPMSQSESQQYDSFGRLAAKLDFKGQKTELTYDTLGRVETKKLYATGAGSPSKVYCYSYDELGRQKKIVELQGDGLSQDCATAVALGIVPPPSQSLGAVAGRWAAKHSFGITLNLCALCVLLLVLWIGRERTQGTQEFGPLNTRITRKVLVLTRWRPLAYLAGPILILCELCDLLFQSIRSAFSVQRSAFDVHAVDTHFRPFRLALYLKCVTIWTAISLLGTEWRYEVYAANCAPSQTPIDDSVRVTEFTYDVDGRVTQVCSPEGTINYEYDAATGRKTRTYTADNDTRFTYDQLGRLKTVAVHKKNGQAVAPAEVTTYNYTDVGSRESVEMANGTRTTYEYNNLNRLTKVQNLAGSTLLSSYEYTLHQTGRRTGSTELRQEEGGGYSTNNITWNYDQMYRLTNETLNASVTNDNYNASYVYDLVGNRLAKDTQHSGLSTQDSVSYSYNANDQLLQEISASSAPSAVTNSYTYDANGSLTNQITQHSGLSTQDFSYDLDNRLSGATISRYEGTNLVEITASYLYNPSGIRVRSDTQTQINGSPGSPSTKHTFYLVDSMNHTGYAQVLEEHSSLNSQPSTLDRSYTIGDDVLAQSDGTGSPATHFLGYDGHGSTRILTDASVSRVSP